MTMRKVRPSNLEIVLLPGNSDRALGNDKLLGPHTVAVSGLIYDEVHAPDDDDHTNTVEYIVDIQNLLWEPKFLQASTMTSWGEIVSPDSDEVDHSRWGIRKIQTGHTDKVITGHAVRYLRLKIEIRVQGEMNYWNGIGFQTIANGKLLNLADVIDSVNRTRDIPYTRE